MAAQVAAVGGLIVASAGIVRAQDAAAQGATPSSSHDAEAVAELLRVHPSSKGNCGCAPCWGPPAPPAMPTGARASGEAVA
jgi:hypothetical protein